MLLNTIAKEIHKRLRILENRERELFLKEKRITDSVKLLNIHDEQKRVCHEIYVLQQMLSTFILLN